MAASVHAYPVFSRRLPAKKMTVVLTLPEDHAANGRVEQRLQLPRILHAVALALRPVRYRQAPRALLGPVVAAHASGINAMPGRDGRIGRPRREVRSADGSCNDADRRGALAALGKEVRELHSEEDRHGGEAVEAAELDTRRRERDPA
jgi:hypothetical protein